MANPPGRLALSLMLLIAGLLLIPAVSAEEVLNEHIDSYEDTSASVTYEHSGIQGSGQVNLVRFNQIQNHRQVNYVIFNGKEMPYSSAPTEGRYEITYTLGGITKPAVMYISASRNLVGSITSLRYTVFFEDWDIGALTGVQDVTLSKSLGTYKLRPGTPSGWGGFISKYAPGAPGVTYYEPPLIAHDVIISSQNAFENQIVVDLENGLYNVQILRYLGGNYYKSTMNVKNNDSVVYTNSENIDKSVFFDEGEINKIDITAPDGIIYTYLLTSAGPGDTPIDSSKITLYIRSSQTNALIANARAVISAGFNDPADLQEVSNTTLPTGTKTYTLQPTGGGLPNPDYYRVTVTADGYNAEMPYADIELEPGVSMTMIMGMEPTSGGPIDPEKTYIEFYVRDINANPIPNAVVKCGAYTLMTNSAGFTQFDLPKNATYQYTVRKTGYTAIEGTVTVGANSRYPVNIVLGPGTVPTYTPTPGPGATPTPDTRTNEQKGQEVIDLIADFALPIAILAILATLSGLLSMMMPRRR